jgi:hypothetical protein
MYYTLILVVAILSTFMSGLFIAVLTRKTVNVFGVVPVVSGFCIAFLFFYFKIGVVV